MAASSSDGSDGSGSGDAGNGTAAFAGAAASSDGETAQAVAFSAAGEAYIIPDKTMAAAKKWLDDYQERPTVLISGGTRKQVQEQPTSVLAYFG